MAGLAVGTVLLAGGAAHADGDSFPADFAKQHAGVLQHVVEQADSHGAQLPAGTGSLGVLAQVV